MLTRRGKLVLALALLLLIAGRILGVTELFGLAAAGVAVVVTGVVRLRTPQLRVVLSSRVVPAVIARGDLATLEVAIENVGSVPTQAGRISLVALAESGGPLIEVPRLVPGERASVALRLPTERRGRHEVSGFEAVLGDSLGTCRRRLTSLAGVRYGVRPLPEELPASLPAGEGGADLETTRSAADRLRSGASLLRPYIAGDDLRRIHWATTARVDQLMVREGGDRELDTSSGVVMILSPHAPAGEAAFELAVRVAASVLVAAEREGTFRLFVPGVLDTGEAAGEHHLDAVFEALTDLEAKPVPPPEPGALPSPKSLEGRVVFLLAACGESANLASHFSSPAGDLVPPAAAVLELSSGGSESSLVQLDRRHLQASLSDTTSFASLWAGEPALVSR